MTKREERQLSELLELWESMNERGRQEVLRYARSVAECPDPPMTKAEFDALGWDGQIAALKDDPNLLKKLR